MEDVDESRVVEGSADEILRMLEALGFEWNETVIYQSQRKRRYAEVLDQLSRQRLAYVCSCSRREIAALAKTGIEGPVYPGTCRKANDAFSSGKAVRLRTTEEEICFEDLVQGKHCQVLSRDIGDFVIHRADGYTAYQLAVVVDDADQRISRIVRGADLLLSTPRQIYLQNLLGFPRLAYAHVPLVKDDQGRKLSKQDLAHPVSADRPLESLLAAWHFLRQISPSQQLDRVEDFWLWAADKWDITRISALNQ